MQKYRWHLGFTAWLLHRLTGVLLLLYLLVHIAVVQSVAQGPQGFDRVMAAVQSPPFLLFEVALLAAVLYHTLNGLRLLLLDAGWGLVHHKTLFGVLALAGLIALVLGGYPILRLLGRTFPGG